MSNNKDNLIISWLLLLTLLIMAISLMLDKDIDAINKTLEYITRTQEQSTAESSRFYSDYTYAMTEIDNGQTEIKDSLADTNEKVSSIETQVAQHEEAIKAIPTPKAETASKKPKKTNLTEKEIRRKGV